MKVHLLRAVSSSGVSNFELEATVQEGRESYGKETADFLKRDFYVYDCLKSFATLEQAISFIKNSHAMCDATQLRLHKFASNTKRVLEALPVEDCVKTLKDLDLRPYTLPLQRSLGTYWHMESDAFGFKIELQDKPCAGRGILSFVSSIYDLLGMAAPIILVGKRILQDLCCDNFDWDDPIPDDIYVRWEKWRSELPLLQ